MKKYKLEVTEILTRKVEVSATDEETAYQIVGEMYNNEDIVLGSEDFVDVNILMLSDK